MPFRGAPQRCPWPAVCSPADDIRLGGYRGIRIGEARHPGFTSRSPAVEPTDWPIKLDGHSPVRCGVVVQNVRSLAGKIGQVADVAHELAAEVMVLCESNLSHATQRSAAIEFARLGWHRFLPSDVVTDAAGKPTAGVAIVSKFPCRRVPIPPCAAGRAVACRIQGLDGSFILVGFYGHAKDTAACNETLMQLAKFYTQHGEQVLIAGDFNLEPGDGAVCELVRSGQFHLLDDSFDACERLPTSSAGRTIDYGIATLEPAAAVKSRRQLPGVADHHAVCYGLDVAPHLPSLSRRIVDRIVAPDERPLDDEDFFHDKDQWADQFSKALEMQDTDAAWVLLSAAAERLLRATPLRGSIPRSSPMQLTRPAIRSGRHGATTTLERELARLARRIAQLRIERNNHNLLHAINRDLDRLAPKCHRLEDVDPFADNAEEVVRDCAQDEAQRAKAARLQTWIANAIDNDHRLNAFVKGDRLIEPATWDEECSPQARAEKARTTWHSLWTKPCMPEANLNSFLEWTEQARPASVPSLNITGPRLRAAFRRMQGSAAGGDQWRPDDLYRLPDAWHEDLAKIWSCIVNGASIPDAWLDIRVVAIPKRDGGERPISVASSLWRAGMSAAVHQLRPWILQWASPGSSGGLPARSLHDIIQRIQVAIDQADPRNPIAGICLDLAKAFDSVSPDQALLALKRLGFPPGLADASARFYQSNRRWIEWQGAVACEPIRATISLLQGCPLAPLMLVVLMQTWEAHAFSGSDASVARGLYLDDRTIWAQGSDAVRTIARIIHRGQACDDAMGFKLNASKGIAWATHGSTRKKLDLLKGYATTVQSCPKILGILVNTTKAVRTGQDDEKVAIAFARLERISILRQLPMHNRKKLVGRMVLPLIAWKGAWNRLAVTTLNKLTAAVERAVLARKVIWPHRSRAITWATVIGAGLHPGFAANIRAVFQFQRAIAIGHGAIAARSKRLLDVCRDWGWQFDQSGMVDTLWGRLHLLVDGPAVIRRFATLAWERALFMAEPRGDAVFRQALGTHHPALATQRAWAAHRLPQDVKVAVGSGACGKIWSGAAKRDVPCFCGLLRPGREHLLWECDHTGALCLDIRQRPPPPQLFERVLAVHLVRRPSPTSTWSQQNLWQPLHALSRLFDATVDLGHRLVIASDGSAVGRIVAHRIVSFGVATLADSFGAVVPTADQSAVHAESFGLLQVLLALACSVRARFAPITIIIDNKHVVDMAKSLLRSPSRPLQAFSERGELWQRTQQLLHGLAQHTTVEVGWVPSHGKSTEWVAPQAVDTALWRQLNEAADLAATSISARAYAARQHERDASDAADASTATMLTATAAVLDKFGDFCQAAGFRLTPARC
eukprot:TRINITY_DN4861_c0_g1_i1.p2 TRINITY_DN4861_c0_g1~~TRINITY_DN4861_c0_g1_i1.p2  ORF type:complete len:1358 (-),score=164.81 TRINITY_DN4861_c0_g1_i1:1259-5332(-)